MADRTAYFERHCPDPEVRREVESLLRYAQLEATGVADPTGRDTPVEAMGRLFNKPVITPESQIGPYRILGIIGEGGMGTVYRAVRADDQYRKTVAIKVVRLDSRSDLVLRRFRQERQILANLEHPNIARLLDGGASTSGVPFIAMEYVEGQPITVYCREQNLTIPKRLQLFRHVCDAVQYAHQMLIVHRDIKPGNILVTAEGVPKLLDFGIAKLLDAETAGDSTNTQTMTGFRMMTPDYASPEQVRGESATTTTDVYSLGAVLYEILTGERPHQLKTYDALEIARRVCEEEIRPPSATGVPGLRGDLDTILLKALQKIPARRYSSVEKFSEDLLRFLEGRPVLARPDTLFYRTSKYVRRNRVTVVAAAVAALSLGVGLVAERRQARIASERFELVRGIAHKLIFDVHDEVARLPGSIKPREIIVASAVDYLNKLSQTAGNDPSLLNEIAVGYAKVGTAQGLPAEPNLGRVPDALASLRKALVFHERASALDPKYRLDLAEFLFRMRTFYNLTGNPDAADDAVRKGIALSEELNREDPSNVKILALLAISNATLGDSKESSDSHAALAAYRQCREYQGRLVALKPTGENRVRLIRALVRIGTAALRAGELDTSIQALRQAESLMNDLVRDQPDVPSYQRQLALTYQSLSQIFDNDEMPSLEDPAQSIDYARRYVRVSEGIVAKDPNDANGTFGAAMSHLRLSHALRASPRESLAEARSALALIDANLQKSPGSPLAISRRGRSLRRLAECLVGTGDPQKARAPALEALEVQRAIMVKSAADFDEQRVFLGTLNTAGEVMAASGDRTRALALYQEAALLADKLLRHQPAELQFAVPAALTYRGLAQSWKQSGDPVQGAAWDKKQLDIWRNWKPATTYVERRRREAETGR